MRANESFTRITLVIVGMTPLTSTISKSFSASRRERLFSSKTGEKNLIKSLGALYQQLVALQNGYICNGSAMSI